MVRKGKLIIFEEEDLKNIKEAARLTGRKAEAFIRHFSRVEAEKVLKKYEG